MTKMSAKIPYCLYHIDDRFFKLNDEWNTEIKFNQIPTVPNRRTAHSMNIEIIRDRWGVEAHSSVEIKTDRNYENPQKAQLSALKIINDFIQKYRHFDKEAIHLVLLSDEDLEQFTFSPPEGSSAVFISMAGGIRPAQVNLTRNISNDIEVFLNERKEIPFHQELILNAEQYIYIRL